MKQRKFKRATEVAVDPTNFAKWNVSIPPNCAAITKSGVVIVNDSDVWANLSVFTPRDQQVLGDIKQIDINELINQMLENKEKSNG